MKRRKFKFQGDGYPEDAMSLILKEGISDGILEVFVLC
jgi:hypothetical protein